MPSLNAILISCSGLFEPINSIATLYAKNNFQKPAQQAVALFRELAQQHKLCFAETTFSGLALEDRIILPNGANTSKDVVWHEHFHLKIRRQQQTLLPNYASTVIEESFAETYASLHTDKPEDQLRLIYQAENARARFNRQIQQKDRQIRDDSWTNPLSYPLMLHDLSYKAYTDLAVKMFKKHKIQKTIEHTAVACRMADLSGDHHHGIGYLNSTLAEKDIISNPLAIKSLYATDKLYLCLETEDLFYDLYGSGDSTLCSDLAEKVFELFCQPLLLVEAKTPEICPSRFLRDYNERKRKLNK